MMVHDSEKIKIIAFLALISLATSVQAQPANDFPCDAFVLPVRESCTYDLYTNGDATSSGVLDPGCGFFLGGDVWFKLEIPLSGSLDIQTNTEAEDNFPDNDGWLYRGGMAIYSGSCDNLTLMECNVDNGSNHARMPGTLLEGLTPGDSLWIRIWEYGNSDNGMFEICVVDPNPSFCTQIYMVSGGGEYCRGGANATVQLSGSEAGVSYTLLRNDIFPLDTLEGTGAMLTWSSLSDEGTYKIIAEHLSSACTLMMADSAEIVLYDFPLEFTVSGGGVYFDGDTGVAIFLDGSEPGTSYTLLLNGTSRRDTLAGTGGPLQWSPLLEEGFYRVEAERFAEACPVMMFDSAEVVLLEDLSEYNVGGGGGYCQDDSGVSVTLSGSDPGIWYTLILNDTLRLDTLTGSGDLLSWPLVSIPGVYRVEAAKPNNGMVVMMNGTSHVEMFALPQLSASINDATCSGLNNGSINLTVSGPSPYEFLWTGPLGFVSNEEDPINLAAGAYEVTVTDSTQCVSTSAPLNITEPEKIVVSVESISPLSSYDACDGSVEITISGGVFPYSVYWSGTDNYESTMEDPDSMTVGYYRVMVTDQQECTESIEGIRLVAEEDPDEIFIPESFSPNGDGYNDRFVILGIEHFADNELMVFTRQGVTVFYRANYQNDWDGKPEQGRVLGGELPEGTYYYIFKYGQNEIRKGFVYINRE